MANITLRSGLNRPLTVEELDNNFVNVNNDLLSKSPIISPTFTGIVTAPTFASTVATGTAPFAVASTTPVTNLNIGGNAATVTTNANLTGMVTSVGNAATVVTNANLTGMITSVGNAASLGSFTSLQLATALTDETGSGANVFATSPTLVTPFLGTPAALVGTNITGTATAFTASNVTTNANLTGAVTSVGNGTSLGSFTSAQLLAALTNKTGTGFNVFSDSPSLVTPALGTPSSGVVTYLTGTASININGTVGASTASTGAFTTLSATSTVSGTGFSTYLASPPAIGGTTADAGRFTQITSTVATGTAPFVVASTTAVANLSIGGNAATVTGITQQNGTRSNFNFDTLLSTGFYNYDASPTNRPVGYNYGQVIVAQGTDTGWQIAGGYTNNMSYRGWYGSGGTFTAWKTLLDSSNYNSYSPTLTGGGASGSWDITAKNQSGGTVSATTGAFSSTITLPSHSTSIIKAGTGDGASFTTYNLKINSWWGIGFGDYQDLATVKAYIDCRSGNIGTSGAFLGNVTGNVTGNQSGGTVNATTGTFSGAVTINGANALRGSHGAGADTNSFAAGDRALDSNTTGGSNTAVGVDALTTNTQGGENVAVGFYSLKSNTIGVYNVGVGTQALTGNSTGTSNTALGALTLPSNTTGSSNTTVGASSLNSNTVGANNTAVGASSLNNNTNGNYNTAIGDSALNSNISGSYNTAVGDYSLSNTTGSYNTAVGDDAGLGLTSGSYNQVFGNGITLAAGSTGRIGIGSLFTHGLNNTVIIGNGVGRISCSYTSSNAWTFSSDERLKNVIGKDTLGLSFINDLEPVTYRWKPTNEIPKELTVHYTEENVQDTNIVMHGLIAQNVKAALDKAGVNTFTGWSEDEDGTQRLGTTDLITPMINAIKELTARLEALEGKL